MDLTGEDLYSQEFMTSTYNTATNECDNFVLEMHYKVYFRPATEQDADDDVFVDPPDYECSSGAKQNT